MQKCKYTRERFSGYYFDEETNTIYSLINVFIAATSFEGNEVKLEFHYGDKTEVLFPSDDEINAFVETYINEIKHTRG
jgi:hypothetical protein